MWSGEGRSYSAKQIAKREAIVARGMFTTRIGMLRARCRHFSVRMSAEKQQYRRANAIGAPRNR
jgi:hypothetical protein